jgi:hypothetical protein
MDPFCKFYMKEETVCELTIPGVNLSLSVPVVRQCICYLSNNRVTFKLFHYCLM